MVKLVSVCMYFSGGHFGGNFVKFGAILALLSLFF
jgi:hypothetical protein